MSQSGQLSGKRALVTGSTSGIGLGIARAMAGEGADLVISGFGDADEIASLCDELGAKHIDADLLTANLACQNDSLSGRQSLARDARFRIF